MQKYTFHILPNAHLDPVWLWDWREGLNEGIITVNTILNLMDRYPDLTFIRGEASIYEHLATYAPATLERIKKMIAAGRWDVVGGTYVQCDTNMPATEPMARQLTIGQNSMKNLVGRSAQVAWWPDSFGHSAALPNILAEAGIRGMAASRPSQGDCPLPSPAVRWRGSTGAEIVLYRMIHGWYGTERHEVAKRLDDHLAAADGEGLQNIGVFFGLGNHGGGPSANQIEDVHAWAKQHPEVNVKFSTLTSFIDALSKENLPVYEGELNYCLRGCYTSVAKHKSLYRWSENAVSKAETVDTAIHDLLKVPGTDLSETWRSVLFNAFHDILPGSSIERAHEDQLHWLGGAIHQTQRTELAAINHLAEVVDTSVPKAEDNMPTSLSYLVFNPLPKPFKGLIELNGQLDYRPIFKYEGRPAEIPVEVRGPDCEPARYQTLRLEDEAMSHIPWRYRVAVQAELPPLGWGVYTMGYVEQPQLLKRGRTTIKSTNNAVENSSYKVQTGKGAKGIQLYYKGKKLFTGSGLTAITVEDHGGSWGSPENNHSTIRHNWHVTATHLMESGPLQAALWVRLEGGSSRLDLTFTLTNDSSPLAVEARVLWSERAARLKLVMPAKVTSGEFEVPGGVTQRGSDGEVPGTRWVRLFNKENKGIFGFTSDLVYGFDITRGALRASIIRSSRYACGRPSDPVNTHWIPAMDQGELRFNFLIGQADQEFISQAQGFDHKPIVQMVLPATGELPRMGSIASIIPDGIRLLALKRAEDSNGVVIRLQEMSGKKTTPEFVWQGEKVKLPALAPGEIATFVLASKGKKVKATRTDLLA